MKGNYLPPADICITRPKRKNYLDADTIARPFSVAIAHPRYAEIRTIAEDVFSAAGHARVECPLLIDRPNGLILRWDEDGRYLFVRITFDGTIAFVIDVERRVPGNKKWTLVSKEDNIEIVIHRAARYISGEEDASRTKKGQGSTNST